MLRIRRWNRCVEYRRPVELDIGVLRLERAAHCVVEWLAPDLRVGGWGEPVKDVRPALAPPVRRGMDEREVLVSAAVAAEAEERHLGLRTSDFRFQIAMN